MVIKKCVDRQQKYAYLPYVEGNPESFFKLYSPQKVHIFGVLKEMYS